MCLLERVDAWDSGSVRCIASSHRDIDNPLRANGRLAAACGIEFAAQAMAVHGALLARRHEPPAAGFLASVRGVTLHVARLDDIVADLAVHAVLFSGDGNSVLYDFSICAENKVLLEGRATVILSAAAVANL